MVSATLISRYKKYISDVLINRFSSSVHTLEGTYMWFFLAELASSSSLTVTNEATLYNMNSFEYLRMSSTQQKLLYCFDLIQE
jgi:hypothetical protein